MLNKMLQNVTEELKHNRDGYRAWYLLCDNVMLLNIKK